MWRSGSEMDLAVRGGTERVVSWLEPFEADEGEPAVRLQKVCSMLRAPGSVSFCQAASCAKENSERIA